MKSKFKKYNDRIVSLHEEGLRQPTAIARHISKEEGLKLDCKGQASSTFRRYVRNYLYGSNKIKGKSFETVRQVKNSRGEVIWKTEKKHVVHKDLKAIPAGHEIVRLSTNEGTGQQWVITERKKWNPEEDDTDYLQVLADELHGYVPKLLYDVPKKKQEASLILADLHFGAYIEGLKTGDNYSITTFVEDLETIAEEVRGEGYEKVHLLLLGDLIESFTGLNHKNSWKGLQKGMFGAKAIKLLCELLSKHLLEKLPNLGSIKIVAGNHDRTTSDSKEDTDGGAAELISWGLALMGYTVEFSPSLLNFKMGG